VGGSGWREPERDDTGDEPGQCMVPGHSQPSKPPENDAMVGWDPGAVNTRSLEESA